MSVLEIYLETFLITLNDDDIVTRCKSRNLGL